jgi:uncharacterized membrane protein YeaQ/YmgE (transglycosylase-associated protein family)
VVVHVVLLTASFLGDGGDARANESRMVEHRCDRRMVSRVLILAIISFGMLVGAAAQFLLGTGRNGIDWAMALIAGLAGSFVGGLLASLIAGDGLALKPSGLIGSFVGAVIVTAIWRWFSSRRPAPAPPQRRAAARRR